MHYMLREALRTLIAHCERPNLLRSEDEVLAARGRARVARTLLLHDPPNDEVERWFAEYARGGR